MKYIRLMIALLLCAPLISFAAAEEPAGARVLVQGHASLRITVPEGKVIYIDPYAGDGYDAPADLILLTHGHEDHTKVNKIRHKNKGCQKITWKEALKGGKYHTFDLDWVTVEAVQAGNNKNHSLKNCVGYILTFTDGKTLYVSGDTSTTEQMGELAARRLDCAFFCCDGTYNMGVEEALACAKLVAARVSVPYHPVADDAFAARYGATLPEGVRLVRAGEEFTLE